MRLFSVLAGAVLLCLLAMLPARAERVLTTADDTVVFIASGEPRERFGTAYISDGGRDRARLETELGYAGVRYKRYVTLSNANAREMLADTDMVTALPANLLAQPFAERFFVRQYFAFMATPEGLEPVSVKRPDGRTLAARDLGPLATGEPAGVPAGDRDVTLLATAAPLQAGRLDVRRYGMTIPRDWLAGKLAVADIRLGDLSEIGANGLAAAVAAPGEAVIFLSQNQGHPTLAPVFRPETAARFYAVTNFGVLPVQPEAAPLPVAAPSAVSSEAPAAAVSPRAEPAKAAPAAATAPPPAVEEGPPPPYFDLTSTEMYVMVARDRAELAAMRGGYLPLWLSLLTEQEGRVEVVKRKAFEFHSFLDHKARSQAVTRYLEWLAADRGLGRLVFSGHQHLNLVDETPQNPAAAQGYVVLPVLLSSDLARPELTRLRKRPGTVFAILDRHGLRPIRPVVGRPPEGPTVTIAEPNSEGFAHGHRTMRSEADIWLALPVGNAGITGVYSLPAARSVNLSSLPPSLRGDQTKFTALPLQILYDLSPADQVRMLNEPGMALAFGGRSDWEFDPIFDRLFTGDRGFVDRQGAPVEVGPFPASALRPTSPAPGGAESSSGGFCGVAAGPFLLATEARAPGQGGQGSRYLVAASDSQALALATAAGFGSPRQYFVLDDADFASTAARLRINYTLAVSSPDVAARLLGAGFDCTAVVATPF